MLWGDSMKQRNTLQKALSIAGLLFGALLGVAGLISALFSEGDGELAAIGLFLLLGAACTIAALLLSWRKSPAPVRPASGAPAAAPAGGYKAAYLRYMDEKGLKYRDVGERTVDVSYNANNADTILIRVIFDADDSGHVHFICGDVGSFKDKVPEGVLICNAMNMNYRWAKFYLNQQNSVVVDSDAIIDGNIVGPACVEIVERLVDIIDKAYPEFMKVKWGQYDS